MKKSSAFTLAEVLITLGIIGVVAAMTIPNLIANTNGAKYRSGFKKAISTLNQAGLMAQAQYDFDFAGASDYCDVNNGGSEHPESKMSFCAIFNGTLTGQTYLGRVSNIKRQSNTSAGSSGAAYTISNASDGGIWNDYTKYIAYSLADGSIVAFYEYASGCSQPIGRPMDITSAGSYLAYCSGFIDVNGTTLPNKAVTCTKPGDGNTAKNKASRNVDKPCIVENNATNMTDVFPVIFHDATVEPATDAAKYVLMTSK